MKYLIDAVNFLGKHCIELKRTAPDLRSEVGTCHDRLNNSASTQITGTLNV